MKTVKWMHNDMLIILEHSVFNITLKVDGNVIIKTRMGLFNTFWRHDFIYDGYAITSTISTKLFDYTYKLCVNSIEIDSIAEAQPIKSKPEANENTSILTTKIQNYVIERYI